MSTNGNKSNWKHKIGNRLEKQKAALSRKLLWLETRAHGYKRTENRTNKITLHLRPPKHLSYKKNNTLPKRTLQQDYKVMAGLTDMKLYKEIQNRPTKIQHDEHQSRPQSSSTAGPEALKTAHRIGLDNNR